MEHHKLLDKSIHQVQDYSPLEFINYCSSEEESEDEA